MLAPNGLWVNYMVSVKQGVKHREGPLTAESRYETLLNRATQPAGTSIPRSEVRVLNCRVWPIVVEGAVSADPSQALP